LEGEARGAKSAAALFAEAPGARRWTRVGGLGEGTRRVGGAHECCATPRHAHARESRETPLGSRAGRVFRRSEGARSESAPVEKRRKSTSRWRRTPRRTVRAARGEACMTPCIVLRRVLCAVGERSHEPVARRVTARAVRPPNSTAKADGLSIVAAFPFQDCQVSDRPSESRPPTR
jgi:hypothetical protein